MAGLENVAQQVINGCLLPSPERSPQERAEESLVETGLPSNVIRQKPQLASILQGGQLPHHRGDAAGHVPANVPGIRRTRPTPPEALRCPAGAVWRRSGAGCPPPPLSRARRRLRASRRARMSWAFG